jgi:hypothetical protein
MKRRKFLKAGAGAGALGLVSMGTSFRSTKRFLSSPALTARDFKEKTPEKVQGVKI